MPVDQEQVQQLVDYPSESLTVELKRWFDPATSEGNAKLVKALLALRNRNGGFLLVGFDDATRQPVAGAPANVRDAFHPDTIQQLVSRYANERFEVEVHFAPRDDSDRVVISVPAGVTAPVAVVRPIADGNGREIVKAGEVPFRTLHANGVASTANARPEDWRELVDICFENREADVARFIRRHLTGTPLSTIAAALVGGDGQTLTVQRGPRPIVTWLDEAHQRLAAEVERRNPAPEDRKLLEEAYWEVGMVVDPQKPDALPTREFIRKLAMSNPSYTGWPSWLDTSSFTDQGAHPVARNHAFEAAIIHRGMFTSADFVVYDPRGRFFQRRPLEDDTSESVPQGTTLEPILVILRVAEAIASGLAIVPGLGWETGRLEFGFRWAGLSRRKLLAWANPTRSFFSSHVAVDDAVEAFVELPLDTAPAAIAPFVHQIVSRVFSAFNGFEVSVQFVDQWVQKLINRKL